MKFGKENPNIILAIGISLMVIAMLIIRESRFLEFFFGINPAIVTAFAMTIGFVSQYTLSRQHFFKQEKVTGRSLILLFLIPVVLAGCMVIVDLFAVFDEEVNVRLPNAFLFYPVMGYIATMLFQLLPLTVVYPVAKKIIPRFPSNQTRNLSLLLVATVEPLFQIAFTLDVFTWWENIFQFVIIYSFNFIELKNYQKYGLWGKYIARLAYYLIWHYVWGYLRLTILF